VANQVQPIPEGYTTLTPYITVKDGDAAIAFYKKAFGAEELFRMPGPDGKSVMHAELQIGNARMMLGEEMPVPGTAKSPESVNTTTVSMHLYVPDVDASYKRALEAGATSMFEPMDAFWGDRFGKVVDPFGHQWGMATHIADLTPEEVAKGAKEWFKNSPECGQA